MHNVCLCGANHCDHVTVIDGELIERDDPRWLLKGKWETKDIEDFKDKILNKAIDDMVKEGMY